MLDEAHRRGLYGDRGLVVVSPSGVLADYRWFLRKEHSISNLNRG